MNILCKNKFKKALNILNRLCDTKFSVFHAIIKNKYVYIF